MNIVVLTGSPRRTGHSNSLADSFVKGAKEAGNEVYRFDAGLQKQGVVHFLRVDENERTIVDDDFIHQEVLPRLIKADMVVFVASLYYFGMNAQLKTVIDRFYEFNHELKDDKKSVFLLAGYGSGESFQAMITHFELLQKYMRWSEFGRVVADDSWTERKFKKHLEEAYLLGKSIK